MFETDRLVLRRFSNDDARDVFSMRSDDELMRFIRPAQLDPKETESWIKLVSSRWETDRIGFCAVVEKSSRSFIGWCGLWRLRETLEVEVGYALKANFRGRGLAVEAASAMLDYGFGELGFEKIVAVARPENAGSRRVMERLGMIYDYTGRFYDAELVHYSIIRRAWERARVGMASGRV